MIVKPSLYGGANWPPSSFDPVRQRLFVCASSLAGNFRGGDEDFEIPPDGEPYDGGVLGFASLPRTGIFAAVDMTTNELVWRYRWPDQCYSGSVATAGGLVFVGRNDGRLTALDSDTGRQLWEFQTGAGMNAPASVFEHGGEQYVAAYSAGNVLIGSAHGDSVWLFSLNGTLPSATAAGAVTSTSATAEQSAAAAAASSDGATIFRQACVPCHGEDGAGGHGGGAPLDRVTDLAAAIQTVTEGRNAMPAFARALTDEQIRAVSRYIVEQLSD
jgi:alcohol dehydrogenase (cytochrome c)